MKPLLPGSDRESRRILAVSAAGFGLGILASLFLSSRLLILIEAVLIVSAAVLLLSDR